MPDRHGAASCRSQAGTGQNKFARSHLCKSGRNRDKHQICRQAHRAHATYKQPCSRVPFAPIQSLLAAGAPVHSPVRLLAGCPTIGCGFAPAALLEAASSTAGGAARALGCLCQQGILQRAAPVSSCLQGGAPACIVHQGGRAAAHQQQRHLPANLHMQTPSGSGGAGTGGASSGSSAPCGQAGSFARVGPGIHHVNTQAKHTGSGYRVPHWRWRQRLQLALSAATCRGVCPYTSGSFADAPASSSTLTLAGVPAEAAYHSGVPP